MTEPRNIRALPVSQLSADELKQLRDGSIADLSALSQRPLEEKLLGTTAYQSLVDPLRERIQQIDAELRGRREMRIQESMLSVSQGMLEVTRSILREVDADLRARQNSNDFRVAQLRGLEKKVGLRPGSLTG